MRLQTLLTLWALYIAPCHAAQIALIMDDIGDRKADVDVLTLPPSVTLSVLPFTPLTTKLAEVGHDRGHEIMLHLPMQALNGKAMGTGGLTNEMGEDELRSQVLSALASVPHAKGVNNHMGSLLTQMEQPMAWLMGTLKQQQVYFIDSRTTQYTVAETSAQKAGVPVLARKLFLDNDVSEQAIEAQFNLMIQQAHIHGQLVAIAHPYPETIKFLRENIERLEQEGIELVTPTQLLSNEFASNQLVQL
ncbi:divergent polysaccharide deacetylase family protein [Shewanella sp. A25]|nr:divergent polysaccharide deacetylase family protein [Shewanella shenzhenensis]